MSKNYENKDKTKKVKTTKEDIKKGTKKKGKKSKHPKLWLAIKIFLILLVLGIVIGAGVVAGVFFGLFGDDLKISAEELNITIENSTLIALNGEEIATLNGDENREVISIAEMGEYIPKAFVAIEDKRFYQHSGVDIKRTAGAVLKYFSGDSSYGGSTITQQLIKNSLNDKDRDWKRKVREIAKAYQIEKEMSKDQILEAYLNTIPLGGGQKNIYGVQVASKFYFDKNPIDLTIAQAAYIAGINHSPNIYNPFKEKTSKDKIANRTKTVLKEMLDQELINKEQYDVAVEEVNVGLAFKEGTISDYNALTQNEEAAVQQVAREYAAEHDLSYDIALQRIKSGGFKIYITENKEFQNIMDIAYTDNKDWMQTTKVSKKDEQGNTTTQTVQIQSAMVIIDHKTGYVVASRGVLGDKVAWGKNRAIIGEKQPGSSIKPLAVIAPSLQEGLITAATVVDDIPTSFGSYSPHNDTGRGSFYGLMNIRYILRVSRNIPEVKMMKNLTPTKSIKYLREFGISTMDDEKDNSLPLALGGVWKGISPLEMAAAYATLANNGEYIEPTFYIKVEDSKGNVILQKEQQRRRVISEQNAYIMQSLLTEPTGTGLTGSAGATATGAVIKGQQTCGKTGTTDDNKITWFCGFTPYYSGAMYFAYDEVNSAKAPGSGTVARRWNSIMTKVHAGLESARFDKTSGLVNAVVCSDSGLLATDICAQDPRPGRTYSEMFVKGTVPTQTCDIHVKVAICKETGKLATEFCTDTEERVFITRPEEDRAKAEGVTPDSEYMVPLETCDKHTQSNNNIKPEITLKGKENVTVKINEKYKDEGATAKDSVDGDLTSEITTEIKFKDKVVKEVDTSIEGTYTITYTVKNKAGNSASVTRTVKVEKKENNTNTNTNTAEPINTVIPSEPTNTID